MQEQTKIKMKRFQVPVLMSKFEAGPSKKNLNVINSIFSLNGHLPLAIDNNEAVMTVACS